MRFLSEEMQNVSPRQHSQSHLVQNMKNHFDLHIVDAFSAIHRSHASLVGFIPVLDSYAGPVMRKELENCSMVRDEFEEGVLLLGGEKPSDIVGMMEHMVEDVEKILLAGIPGELALIIEGYDLGKKEQWIKEKGFDTSIQRLEQLIEEYRDKIVLPEDLRTESGVYTPGEVPGNELTWDIGDETTKRYCKVLSEADAVVMKGPTGAFEDYPKGSEKIVESLADSDGFTVIGGGHTSSLVQRFGYSLDDFSHVSIAGGAFVRYMSGEDLVVVEDLKK
ncbi:MAG: 3-phosphoglycerate kinase [Candidatus Nanosalina sp. J07AB43]|nr:MAG: 3-phosphoglycerate kinase [Candidatus Nanosalina sp. J07AB43]